MFLLLAPGAQAAKGIAGIYGGHGQAEGQFESLQGIDANVATGDFYVSDTQNGRLQRFDAEGNFELAFGWGVDDGSDEFQICTDTCQAGSYGAGAGEFGLFVGPQSLAIDQADGSVYVLDPGNRRIQKFDQDGNFVLAFGWGVADGAVELQTCTITCQAGTTEGAAANEFNFSSIAVDPTSGNVLAGDPSNFRVQEYDSEGHFVRSFGNDVEVGGSEGFEVCTEAAKCKPGTEPANPSDPMAPYGPSHLAIDSNGIIYAAFSTRIERFVPSGGTLTPSAFATGVFPPGGTHGPARIAVDRSNDHLVVVDADYSSGAVSLVDLNPDGSLAETIIPGLKEQPGAISFSSATGRGYLAGYGFVYAVDEMEQPEASIEPVTDVTSTSATAHGTINSHGKPAAYYVFEIMLDGSGEWQSLGEAVLPADNVDHQVSVQLSPPGGLQPGSLYHVRLRAFKPGNEDVVTPEVEFTTVAVGPTVETTGTTHYTATTARLEGRVNPRNLPTTYYFEYGTTSAYGAKVPVSEDGDGGSGSLAILAHEQLTGLQPATTYHYRLVATNASGTTVGEERTVTTRASDAPLSHGHLPGPPDSDRAYEQVSLAESGGNPVDSTFAYSPGDGNRVVYQITGGSPISETGTAFSQLFAERTASGWKTSLIWPRRGQANGRFWTEPYPTEDLSAFASTNYGEGGDVWHFGPGLTPKDLFTSSLADYRSFIAASDNLNTVVVLKGGASADPEKPSLPNAMFGEAYLYEVASGTPKIVSINSSGAACIVPSTGVMEVASLRVQHWVSADGQRVFFPTKSGADCGGPEELVMRDLQSETSTEMSGPPLSGPACRAELIKSVPGAAFFVTVARLDPTDSAPAACGDNSDVARPDQDVYRFDFSTGAKECITCSAGVADVVAGGFVQKNKGIGVSEDGSRVYFLSPHRLVAGEGIEGDYNVYRLDVASRGLKYVATLEEYSAVGDSPSEGGSMDEDGSVITFRTNGAYINALTGSDNQGLYQYYRYDDSNGSLTCVSCSPDGTAIAGVDQGLTVGGGTALHNRMITADGNTYVFKTSTPLVAADQNTSKPGEDPDRGSDIYEWRDGRLLLITGGEKNWAGSPPRLSGITKDGRNVFFAVSDMLTPDAPDAFKRLYDARIGGGFEFPTPEPPCPLEICQGEAKGAPSDPTPSSGRSTGPGNVKPKAHRKHRKCVRRHGKKRCHRPHKKKHINRPGGGK